MVKYTNAKLVSKGILKLQLNAFSTKTTKILD